MLTAFTEPHAMRRNLGLLVLFASFLGAILFPRLWLQPTAVHAFSVVRLRTQTNIPNYRFVPEPVDESVIDGLGTANILSGNFISITNQSQRFTIFFATWPEDTPATFKGLGHTPDVCWIGAGWLPAASEGLQVFDVEIPFTQNPQSPSAAKPSEAESHSRPPWSLTFHTQTFERPGTGAQEQAAWCTLVAGKPLAGSVPLNSLSRTALGSFYHSRINHLLQLTDAVAIRSIRGGKQFVRFSFPVESASDFTRAELQSFASQWLRADEEKH
jgi:hypothetical protein